MKSNSTVKLGKNVKLKENVDLNYVEIGDNVEIGKNTIIFGSKDNIVKIEDNAYISPNCYFNGAFGLHIGKDVTVSTGVMIFTDSGPNVGPLKKVYPTVSSCIYIGQGSWICAGSIILPGGGLERESILASLSTLNVMIPSRTIYGGNPAKKIKEINLK